MSEIPEKTSNGDKIERIVESIGARAVARFVPTILLAIIGYLGIEVRNDINKALNLLHAQAIELAVLKQRVETLEANRKTP